MFIVNLPYPATAQMERDRSLWSGALYGLQAQRATDGGWEVTCLGVRHWCQAPRLQDALEMLVQDLREVA